VDPVPDSLLLRIYERPYINGMNIAHPRMKGKKALQMAYGSAQEFVRNSRRIMEGR
jgi:hypothetical protein